MRKLILSALAVGALTPAAAAALAADTVQSTNGPAPGFSRTLHKRAYVEQASRSLRRAKARADRKRERRAKRAVAVPGALQSIAACESHGNPQAVGGGGAFRGKYQFDYGTWASVGGHGDPAAAPEAEQDRRAAMLYRREGTTPWPVCGQ